LTGSGSLFEASGDRRGIDTSQFLAGAMDIEQPLDPSPFGVASTLPMREFTAQGVAIFNASVQALLGQYPRAGENATVYCRRERRIRMPSTAA
jgi:hypothetical protein